MIPVPILIRLGLAAAGVVGIYKLLDKGVNNGNIEESNQNRDPGADRDISRGERVGSQESNGTGAIDHGESTDSGYADRTSNDRNHQPDDTASGSAPESGIEGDNHAEHQTSNDGGADNGGNDVRS